MRFTFWHHEEHGPISLEDLWSGRTAYGGSVGRLRILFWLARRGHEVRLVGNVSNGALNGVTSIAGTEHLQSRASSSSVDLSVLVINNPPSEALWNDHTFSHDIPVILWAGNPFNVEWVRRANRGCPSRIVCVSQHHREYYRIYCGFQFLEVAYSGVDTDIIESAKPDPLVKDGVLFCSIPRRTKGFHNFLAACRLILKESPSTRIYATGSAHMHEPHAPLGPSRILDVDLEAEFADIVTSSKIGPIDGKVHLVGLRSLEEVYGMMKSASLVVVNCNWNGSHETYCRAAVESQFAGTPVVGAKRGSLPEVISQGKTGLLVDRSDPRELAKAIVSIIQEPGLRDRMRALCPLWARPLADFEGLSKEWEGIAERAHSGQRAPAPRKFSGDFLRMVGFGTVRGVFRNLIRGSKLERFLLKKT